MGIKNMSSLTILSFKKITKYAGIQIFVYFLLARVSFEEQ